MSCTCGDATCNCQFVCCCQQDICSCDPCSAVRETCCSICGLPVDTEGRDVCQCFLESRPDTSQATAGQRMLRTENRQLNPIPSRTTEESVSRSNETQFEVQTDQNRTFSSQKVPGRPFYQNEGYNFQLPHMPMRYAPRPVFNFSPMVFLDYSRFHQYSSPQVFRSPEHSLTVNRPRTPDVSPSEKHAYIRNWLERSNPGTRHGQEQAAACSSAITEKRRNIVTPGRKIKGRFPPSKKNTPEEEYKKRSSTDEELTSRNHADFENKTPTLKVDEKNPMLEEAENTRLVQSLSLTRKSETTVKETQRVDLETLEFEQTPQETQYDSKGKQN